MGIFSPTPLGKAEKVLPYCVSAILPYSSVSGVVSKSNVYTLAPRPSIWESTKGQLFLASNGANHTNEEKW